METVLLFIFLLLLLSFLCYSSASPILVKREASVSGKHLYIKGKSFFLFLSFFFLFLFMGLRDISVGIDTETYSNLYLEISHSKEFVSARYEIGYVLLNKFVGWFFPNSPQIFFVIVSLFIAFGYARFIHKYSRFAWISVLLFYLFEYLDISMNLTRQSIAMVIVLFAYDFLVKQRKFVFFFLVILAGLFHYTAFFFLFAYLVNFLSFGKKNIIMFFLLSILLYILSKYLIQLAFSSISIYSEYMNSVYADGNVRLASILNATVILFIIVFTLLNLQATREYFKSDIVANSGRTMFWLIMCGLLIWISSFQFNQLGRLAKYFTVYSIVFIPNILYSIGEKYPRRFFYWSLFFICFAFCYYITIVLFRPQWSGIYPYNFFFL